MMEPFRKFLSSKVKFEWTDQLNSIFVESKLRIVEAIKEGVKIFDLTDTLAYRLTGPRKESATFSPNSTAIARATPMGAVWMVGK